MAARVGIDVVAANRASRVFRQIGADGQKAFRGLSDSAKMASAAMTLVVTSAVVMAAKSAMSLAVIAARAGDTEYAFRRLAASFGADADEIIAALKRASKGTTSEFDLIAKASMAMRLGVATDVETFETLMKIATMRAKEFGFTASQAWGFLVTGIGRSSPLILDNIGFLIKVADVTDKAVEMTGKQVTALTKLDKQQAMVNIIIKEGADSLDSWGEAAVSAADKAATLDAKVGELKISLGTALGPALSGLIDLLLKGSTAFMQLATIAAGSIAYWSHLFKNMGRAVKDWEVVQREAMQASREQFFETGAALKLLEDQAEDSFSAIELAAKRGAVKMAEDFAELDKRSEIYFRGVWEAGKKYLSAMVDIERDLAQNIESIQLRHSRALASLERQTAKARTKIHKDLASALAAADKSATEARMEETRSFHDRWNVLLEEQARARKDFEKDLSASIFEAAGQRDAITIRRLQRQATRDRSRMRRDQNVARTALRRQHSQRMAAIEQQRMREQEQARAAHSQAMADLEQQRRERIEDLRRALNQEIEDARAAAIQKGKDAWAAHQAETAALTATYTRAEQIEWKHLTVSQAAWTAYYAELYKMHIAWRKAYETPYGQPGGSGEYPGYQLGGTIPGLPGAAVPIMAHAGETIVPRGGKQTLVIELRGGIDVSAPMGIASEEIAQALMQGLALAITRVTRRRV